MAQKPRLAFAIATVLGTGYLKPGPGTWGSLVGILVTMLSHPVTLLILLILPTGSTAGFGIDVPLFLGKPVSWILLLPSILVWLALASLGLWSSRKVSQFAGVTDPQYIVIDEVSGVGLTLILGIAPLIFDKDIIQATGAMGFALYSGMSLLNWKYLLAGFILFRIFDIAKPFPCRRLENLPGGWGIMADDWMAGIYAAICLRLALHFHWL